MIRAISSPSLLLNRRPVCHVGLSRVSTISRILIPGYNVHLGKTIHRSIRPLTTFHSPVHHLIQRRFFNSATIGFPMEKQCRFLSVNCAGKKIEPHFADACGNTFLIYDFIENDPVDWEKTKNEIWNLIQSKFVDDALALRKVSQSPDKLVVKMHVLEPDRTEADFCGNGARSIGVYLTSKYGDQFSSYSIASRRGEHVINNKEGTCFINMGQPIIESILPYEHRRITFTLVDAVERHLVTNEFFDQNVLTDIGNEINAKWKERFPQGINVNCIKIDKKGDLNVMTYERGVYKITQACGTGTTASCAAAIFHKWIPVKPAYTISVLGGKLELLLIDNNFWLGGSVRIDGKT